jgi:general secretion pathway protein M
MKNWFDSLEERERQFVLIGAIVVLITLLYVLVWTPLNAKQTALQNDIQQLQRSIIDLRPLRVSSASGDPTRPKPKNTSQQSPLIIVDQTLQGRGLDRYRRNSQPTSSNGIRVVFEDVAFDDLVLWLGDLSEQYAMHVENGSISVGSQRVSGRVNATLTLERAL